MYVDRDNPTTPPSEAVVSTADAKLFLRIDDTTEDALVAELVLAATKYAQQAISQQFVTATYVGYLNTFPNADFIEVEYPPLQSIGSVQYYDTAGELQTFSTDDYTVDTTRRPGRINLAYGKSWPSTYGIPNAVVITFTCGYGAATAVPENIALAIKMLIHEYHENRSPVGAIPSQVYRLLSTSSHGAA